MEFLNIVRDEICAAGLDGIPVTHLWLVLQEPQVRFPLSIDNDTKEFLWNRIKRFTCVEFFVRQDEPAPYIYFDRFQSLTGIETEYYYGSETLKTSKCVYPVDDPELYGSCADFKTRKNVTSIIKTRESTFLGAYKTWGNKLVVVASQRLRASFLTGSETLNPSINGKLYRILELIGKSRYNGIPISGQNGILSYGESSSTIFYVRKLFCGDGLIKSQPFIARESPSRSLRHTTLLHCFRFFKPLPYPLALILEKVSKLLDETPTKMMLPFSIREKCSLGRRAFVRLLKFGVHQGCLKVIHVPFGTACALINRNEGESGEISAEMLRREAAELSGLDPTQPSTMPEPTGRRFVREAAVVYLQRPFDVKQYMMEVHVNRGSRPDSLGNLVENPNDGSAALDDSVQIIRDDDGLAPPADDVLACSPFYAPNVNGDESFCVQLCRILCEMDEKPNTQLATVFNTSHKLISRYTDALAGLGKLLTSKVSTGTSFSIVRRYLTEADAVLFQDNMKKSKQAGITSVYNQRQTRKAFILKCLEEVKVFPSVVELRSRIWAEEEAQGSRVKMDRKSLTRIIDELVKEKKLKFISMEIAGRRCGDTLRLVHLKMICHPSIDTDSPELINCVLAEKKRHVKVPRSNGGGIRPEHALDDEQSVGTDNFDTSIINSATTGKPQHDIQAISRKELELIRLPDKNVSRFRRRCLLHKFLFYLLYEQPQQDVSEHPLPASSSESWTTIYNENSVMYRYVPPVPRRSNALAGCLSFHDLIQVMPLGLFLALCTPATAPRLLLQWLSVLTGGETSLRPVFKELIAQQRRQAASFSPFADLLNSSVVTEDTLRRFELLRTPMVSLPCPGGHGGSLYAWLMSRVNVSKIYGLVEQLSGHGLLTLSGLALHGHVPTASIYLHRRAALLDTRFASPSHHILSDISACPPPLTYDFTDAQVLDAYWLNLRAILLYTPYGFTRFSDPTIGQFLDSQAPILSVERLQDAAGNDQHCLPRLQPTRLKPGTVSADDNQEFLLTGVGGFHASLYLFKAPFEEMGYGTTEQGVCTKYEPLYPSPSLQLQPVVRAEEMAALFGSFEPGLRTIGDGAFWPWTVQLFFDSEPTIPLIPPPMLPAWLFSTRTRRYPFAIEPLDNDADEDDENRPLKKTVGGRRGWRLRSRVGVIVAGNSRRRRRRRGKPLRKRPPPRRRRRTREKSSSSSSSSSNSSSSSESSSKSSSTCEEAGSNSSSHHDDDEFGNGSFDELQPFLQSRKRRMQRKTTIPHIHRRAFDRRRIAGDKRALDERDAEIRKSLHYRRACWCKLEDQMLLTCRVASLFLVGHTREYVCIPYIIVRDILHEYLPVESHDKTSLACARRLKFLLMLRNEERTRADILLTKVSSDPELLVKYNVGKTAWVLLYNKDARQAHQLFRDLVRLIIRNFVPDLRNRCGQIVNTSTMILRPSGNEAGGTEQRHFSIREMLLQSRKTLEERFDFVLLASISNDQDLPDIGSNRPAIVSQALRNLFLGSIRLGKESHNPHDSVLFNRILKQYPYEQLIQAVKCLALTDSLRKVKYFEECDLNVVKQIQMKVTLRMLSWCNVQMFVYVRFFVETFLVHKQLQDEARRLRARLRRRRSTLALSSAPSAADPTSVPATVDCGSDFQTATSSATTASSASLVPLSPETQPPSPQALKEWIITKHNFTEPSSGGLVAIFFELLCTPKQALIKVQFDMSSISILSQPCMSLEDRQAEINSRGRHGQGERKEIVDHADEEEEEVVEEEEEEKDTEIEPPSSKKPRGASSLPFGESTHIGVTVALLEARSSSSGPSAANGAAVAPKKTAVDGIQGNSVAESLMALLLERPGVDATIKGKTPRIDIRLSLNGGSIEACAPGNVPHVTVVDGEPEHKRLCRRVIAKFTSRLNWDAISAKALTSTKQENINTSDNYQPFTRLPAANPSSSTPETPSPDPKTARLANFIFAAGDLGRTFDLIKEQFGDTKTTCYLLHRLLDDQKIFLLGVTEPRYVHWAHLRLWLVHIKDPKRSSTPTRRQPTASSATTTTIMATTEIGNTIKRRRLTLAVAENDVELLAKKQEAEERKKKKHVKQWHSAHDDDATTTTTTPTPPADDNGLPADYYFLPQPWISERGTFKTNFFTHLIQSVCSMVSRHSGAPMDVLAREHRHLLSPVSFRLLCHFLHDMKVIRISRVSHTTKCTLFSNRSPVQFLGDQMLLAPSREISLCLEGLFVSRMQTVFACLCEVFGHVPDDPAPFVHFSRSRAPRQANVLQKQAPSPLPPVVEQPQAEEMES